MNFIKRSEKDFTMSFKEIEYKVNVFNKDTKTLDQKTIINKASGQCKSGQITAIMGPSGSGKTSLLNFITDRIEFPKDSVHTGKLYINSEEIEFNKIPFFSSYVMQDDVLFDVLTPYESLTFACRLRKIVSADKVEECVNMLINDLQISGCKNTLIGNSYNKGISGGEKKRTSIGVELISNPNILFLDEPTSGLDSQTSLKIISLLKRVAQEKNTMVCCTIHQPSSNIFGLFDQLIIIEKGNIIYKDSPQNIGTYFSSIGKPLNKLSNPADSFMRVLEENANENKDLNYFINKYQPLKEETVKNIDKFLETTKEGNNLEQKITNSAGFCEATCILSGRALKNVVRNPAMLRMRIGFTFVISFFVSSVFWKLKPDKFEGIYGRIGFFLFVVINIFMTQVMGTILSFPVERSVFIREYSTRMYSIGSYYVSKNLIETPFLVFFTAILVTIIYFTAGLRKDGAEHFFIYFAITIIHALSAQSLGYVLGTLFSDIGVALQTVNILVMPFVLFAGTLISERTMPDWLGWIRYISPLKYSIEIVTTNEFKNNDLIKFEGGTWQGLLDNFGYKLGIGYCFLIMILANIALRFIAFMFLKLMIKKAG